MAEGRREGESFILENFRASATQEFHHPPIQARVDWFAKRKKLHERECAKNEKDTRESRLDSTRSETVFKSECELDYAQFRGDLLQLHFQLPGRTGFQDVVDFGLLNPRHGMRFGKDGGL
jgi:hypothetical protein